MKKRLCCFLFLLLYLAGFFIGALASGWLYPLSVSKQGQTEKTRQTESGESARAGQTLETWQNGERTLVIGTEASGSSQPNLPRTYPGKVWGRKLFLQYVLYFFLTVALLEIGKKPLPVMLYWLLYGTAAGMYARGLVSFYGTSGQYYGLAGLLILPSILAVLTGVFWIKPGIESGPGYFPYQKRIRDILLALRIRLLPSCFYAAALLLCYVADYEIVKRIQWRLLLRMFGNVVNQTF